MVSIYLDLVFLSLNVCVRAVQLIFYVFIMCRFADVVFLQYRSLQYQIFLFVFWKN